MSAKSLHLARVRAAKKAWETIDEKYGRSGPADNAWKTRRQKSRAKSRAAHKAARTRKSGK